MSEPARVAVLRLDDLEFDPENPNVEDLGTFNELVEGIKEHGFLEPPLVRPFGEVYRVVSGEHRVKAARLAGLREIPCVVKDDWRDDEVQAHIQMVRMNALRGKLNPEKFTKLYTKLTRKMQPDQLRKAMGLGNQEAEFKRLLRDVSRSLPERAREELQKRADRIHSVDDLATVVQSLYTKFGATLEFGFIVFAFGGRTNLMIRSSKEHLDPVLALADQCLTAGVDLSEQIAKRAACVCPDCELPDGQSSLVSFPATRPDLLASVKSEES